MAGGCAQNSILGALLSLICLPDLITCWRTKLSKEFRYILVTTDMYVLSSYLFYIDASLVGNGALTCQVRRMSTR